MKQFYETYRDDEFVTPLVTQISWTNHLLIMSGSSQEAIVLASQPIYQFYAELSDYTPKIWRRFQVFGNITMARLGYIVMTLYEMQAEHLFQVVYPIQENFEREMKAKHIEENIPVLSEQVWRFQVDDNENYFPEEMPEGERMSDATAHNIRSVLGTSPGERLSMEYDFGDGWEVKLTLEAVIEDKELPGRELPRVLEGEGYGIIESCGGPGGLERIAEVFQKKSGEEYENLRAWLGRDDLDLSSFDLTDMNFRLKKIPRIYRDLYEYSLAPTKQSINLLERKYVNSNKSVKE